MPSEVSTVGGDQSVEELRRELAEAREQQAATAEILRVISSAPMDSQRVFAEIAASAARLCDANDAAIFRADGNILRLVGHHGPIPNTADGTPLKRGIVTAHAILDRRTIQVADLQAETESFPESSDFARRDGHRTLLAVPLIRAANAIGTITIRRTEARLFSDKQIALLKTFADQAVIAIENARLFEAEQARTREVTERTRELTEALEQQTATADVLKVISRSALDLQRVLDALVESAARLCNANDAAIFQVFGDGLRLVAHRGQIALGGPVGQYTVSFVRGRIYARAVIDRRTIHVANILAEADEYPESRKVALQVGWRTALCVPLLHAGEAIGVIFIRRTEVRPFIERQIELVNTFADQAVIAIENTRLFEAEQASKRELQESLEQQTATSDVLSVISALPGELEPVFQAMLENATRICNAKFGVLQLYQGGGFRIGAIHKAPPAFAEAMARREPLMRPTPQHPFRRMVTTKVVVQIADLMESPAYKERDPGIVILVEHAVRAFTDEQVAVVVNFANQAVIAIENVRLLNELRESLRQLEIASQHKSQFVANMSHELRTPLAAILGYAELIVPLLQLVKLKHSPAARACEPEDQGAVTATYPACPTSTARSPDNGSHH